MDVIITGTGTPTATNDIQFGSHSASPDPILNELAALNSKITTNIDRQDSAVPVLSDLKTTFPVETLREAPREWELAGLYYLNRRRFSEALSIFFGLYQQLVSSQEIIGWIHKGLPLCWICDCFHSMGYVVHAKRYLMLTLCEDALREKGQITPDQGGVYFRAVWRQGLSDYDFHRIARRFYELSKMPGSRMLFPEALLQDLDIEWRAEIPAAIESGMYVANQLYVKRLVKQLGDKSGKTLEQLAQYLMDCMPGCRTLRRAKTPSTDHDLVCSIDGFEVDFRAEFGRYFLCECKDWSAPADFSTIAKFCRVLDSVKCRFGILFSKSGVSGEGQSTNSEREILKYFQDSGKVIVVVNEDDLAAVAAGQNFLVALRAKYEIVRLDLSKTP